LEELLMTCSIPFSFLFWLRQLLFPQSAADDSPFPFFMFSTFNFLALGISCRLDVIPFQ
jgi:hypothetical protein